MLIQTLVMEFILHRRVGSESTFGQALFCGSHGFWGLLQLVHRTWWFIPHVKLYHNHIWDIVPIHVVKNHLDWAWKCSSPFHNEGSLFRLNWATLCPWLFIQTDLRLIIILCSWQCHTVASQTIISSVYDCIYVSVVQILKKNAIQLQRKKNG